MPPREPDFYGALGVPRDANLEDIKRAYRRVAKRCHPDVAPGCKEEAAARFREAQEAYEVLSDERRRRAHDEELGRLGGRGGDGRDPAAGRRRGPGFFGDEVMHDYFHATTPSGSTMPLNLVLSADEARLGGSIAFHLPYRSPCATCDGLGYLPPGYHPRLRAWLTRWHDCPTCHGQGEHQWDETISIPIPPGVTDGTIYELPLDAAVGYSPRRAGPPGAPTPSAWVPGAMPGEPGGVVLSIRVTVEPDW